MRREPGSLPWVTPAKYVGPGMLAVLFAAGTLVAWFVSEGRLDAAIVTLLAALCFLIVGIADLLGELIRLSAKGHKSSGD